MMLCNVLVMHPSFYGFMVLNIWWPLNLSIVMNFNCFHGGKNILMQICCLNILFGAHQVENVIIFIFELSKFIIFIFGLFQSP
jgi:hypothetical protein